VRGTRAGYWAEGGRGGGRGRLGLGQVGWRKGAGLEEGGKGARALWEQGRAE
jgi:hypothetical protein